MSNTITNAAGVQRSPLVKNPDLITTNIGNPRVTDRDLMRRLNSETAYLAAHVQTDVLTVFFGPSQGLGRGFRKEVERLSRKIGNPHLFPSRVEIEFSTSPADVFTVADGLPEDYRQSAIDWALGLSSAVVIAVNVETSASVVEPYAVLRPVQMVIRCSEQGVSAWAEYLGRRVRPRQRFAVIRFASSEVVL
jgi:hypothetical protein